MKSVILVGSGATRYLLSEYRRQNPDAEVWAMNMIPADGQTRHFQIHCAEKTPKGWPDFRARLLAAGIRVYEDTTYPRHLIRGRMFLRSTVDYMLALADLEGFETVYMAGLDFGGERDPEQMRGATYWIGLLDGKGVRVVVPAASPIFWGDVYR